MTSQFTTDFDAIAAAHALAAEGYEQIELGFAADADRQPMLERAQQRLAAIAELLASGGRAASVVTAELRPWPAR